MTEEKYSLRQHIIRGGIGGALGLLILPRYGEMLNSIIIDAGEGGTPALIISCILYFVIGALAGIATMPFADTGKELVIRSVIHYALTSLAFSALCLVNGWNRGRWDTLFFFIGVLAVFYLTIWLARWIAWLGEISDIREKLGIKPKRSPLGIVEALPYAVLVLLTSFIVSCAGYALDRTGWVGSIITALIIPAGVFWAGVVLGKHNGFAPAFIVLAELAAAAGFGITIFALHLNLGFGWGAAIPAIAALIGNLAGFALGKIKEKRAE
ncbi:MAG: DUF3021 family protein [Oscillospiraceae bacterium]|nr:DUF3021 family protein [Oscillospiraceae bacterium]